MRDEREPRPEPPAPRKSPGSPGDVAEAELERARRVRRISRYLQAGGIVFLAVVSLGLLPTIIASSYPAAGERAAIAIWVVAPAVPIVLLVVAALRLPR